MTTGILDRLSAARAVADAVLYQGYELYPDRASRRKRARWQFGVLTPRSFSEASDSERWYARTECVVEPEPGRLPRLTVRIRCLQCQRRTVEVTGGVGATFVPGEAVEVDGAAYVSGDEAVDQTFDLAPLELIPGNRGAREVTFEFAAGEDTESIRSAEGAVVARVVRRRQPLNGRVRTAVDRAEGAGSFLKLTVTVENSTPWSGTSTQRVDIMDHSLVAVHAMLAVDGGLFVSRLDPPEAAVDAVVGCTNDGAFPVLVGAGDVVLSTSIILDDYPEVALQSQRGLYDGPDIEEIHVLRLPGVMNEEGAQAREDMPPELWERLNREVDAPDPDPSRGDGDAEDGP